MRVITFLGNALIKIQPGAGTMRSLFLPLLIAISLMPLAGCSSASSPDLPAMVAEVRPAVVRITTNSGSGSGVIFETLSEDRGLVLTNHHVVEDTRWIDVEVNDAETFRGKLIGFDPDIDLAVIEICCNDFKTLEFGDVSDLQSGSQVIAIGYPLDLPGEASVTRGIVSAIRSNREFEIIQIDAPINPGNSGGLLVSERGKVLGINTFGIRSMENLGFAISERTVRTVLPQLKTSARLASTPPLAPESANRPAQRPTPVPARITPPAPRPTAIPVNVPTSKPTPTPRPTATRVPTATPSPTPTPMPVELKSIDVNRYLKCGLRLDGAPVCWRHDTSFGDKLPPEDERFKEISIGQISACGIRLDRTLLCWGRNVMDYWRTTYHPWNDVPENEKVSAIALGRSSGCALRQDGSPVCWGLSQHGEASPPKGEKFVAISMGSSHTCALRGDGTPICWGRGASAHIPPTEENSR